NADPPRPRDLPGSSLLSGGHDLATCAATGRAALKSAPGRRLVPALELWVDIRQPPPHMLQPGTVERLDDTIERALAQIDSLVVGRLRRAHDHDRRLRRFATNCPEQRQCVEPPLTSQA